MSPKGTEVAVIACAVALQIAACSSAEEAPQDVVRTLPPEAATEVPEAETTDLAPSSPEPEQEQTVLGEVPPPAEGIAEKLRSASPDGASDPVLIFSDDFSSAGWLEFDEDEFTSEYVDEAYELAVKPGGFSSAFGLSPSLGPLTDFYFEIETQAFGPADNGYGIRFREEEGGFYEFTISNLGTGSTGEAISSGGTFSIDKFSPSGLERVLPFKTETPSIAQGEGQINVLGVLALGPSISLYINGQEVASFSDPDHGLGGLSLRVHPYFEGGSRTLFDNAEVWIPAE